MRDTEDAYQASLKKGDTLQSLTEQANRKGAELAAKKAESAAKKAESKSEGCRAGGRREDDSKRRHSGAWSSESWGGRGREDDSKRQRGGAWSSGSWGSGKERDLPQGK